MKKGKVKTTVVVEKEIWKEFKKLAIDKEMRISELLEGVVREYVKKSRRR
ncbi:MAG: CopG family transcriptional regulator [Candidatus Aenigmatarchaeota archaeon]|nr:MAG: CopG family transcriptional regulator [Candidatus Aenigmarchaeota archaeon]